MATGALIGSPLTPMGSPMSVDPLAAIHVYLDSVIFEDGQVLGPDKFQYYLEIQERYSAVQEFVGEVETGRAAGEDLSTILARVRSDAEGKLGTPSSKASSRRSYYSGLLQRSPNPEGTLRQLKTQTQPPTFRHIGDLR